ncbi:UNKNOWN [Stylonychia lemnae]|uniref:RCC1-like domain-containing protein n=1 Tax=Stylonychia lemnae TaxID=5949 RepID=A0A078AEA8_STYLE|nr:UNKNOWN [Stylonychia lemnae]|eukprot:CDW79837.1 UNKNOWN [Stylonychia lemnae]
MMLQSDDEYQDQVYGQEEEYQDDVGDDNQDNPYNEVYVWGDDSYGQLGLCDLFPEKLITIPKTCSFNVVIKSISCGLSHTCFVSDQGHIYSMGSNSSGQLGLGDKSIRSKNTPTNVETLVDYFICQVSCGNEHTLAISENGVCFAWGQGKYGSLGNGRSDPQFEPILVNFTDPIIDVQAGGHHSAFINKNNTLFMCGDGSKGQLGIGEEIEGGIYKPQQVREDVFKVSCGENHTLIIANNTNRVLACGANDKMQMGMGQSSKDYVWKFQEIEALRNVKAQEIKCWNFSAVIDAKNNFWVWGVLFDSQANKSLCIKTPEQVPKLKVKSIEIGETLAVAVDQKTQNAFIIGTNAKGELGLLDQQARKSFVLVDEISDKSIELISVGKSGYVVAIGQIFDPNQQEYKEVQTREVVEYPLNQDISQISMKKSQISQGAPAIEERVDKSRKSSSKQNDSAKGGIPAPQLSQQVKSKDNALREYEQQISNLKTQLRETNQAPQISVRDKTQALQSIELQSKVVSLEAENSQLLSKNTVLEKKVESLVKFLENERRMRHDLEDSVKEMQKRDFEGQQKLTSFKQKTEQIEQKEASLKKQIDDLIDEQKQKGLQVTEMTKKTEIVSDENKTLKAKLEIQNQKIQNLERENTKLYKQISDLNQQNTAQQNKSQRGPSQESVIQTQNQSTNMQTFENQISSPKIQNYQAQVYTKPPIASSQPPQQHQSEEREKQAAASNFNPLRAQINQLSQNYSRTQDQIQLQSYKITNPQLSNSHSAERQQQQNIGGSYNNIGSSSNYTLTNNNNFNQKQLSFSQSREVLNTFGASDEREDKSPRFKVQTDSHIMVRGNAYESERTLSPTLEDMQSKPYFNNTGEHNRGYGLNGTLEGTKSSVLSQSLSKYSQNYELQQRQPTYQNQNYSAERDDNHSRDHIKLTASYTNLQQQQFQANSIHQQNSGKKHLYNFSTNEKNDYSSSSIDQRQPIQILNHKSESNNQPSISTYKPPVSYSPMRSKTAMTTDNNNSLPNFNQENNNRSAHQTNEKQVRFQGESFNQQQTQQNNQNQQRSYLFSGSNQSKENNNNSYMYSQSQQSKEATNYYATSEFKPGTATTDQNKSSLTQFSYNPNNNNNSSSLRDGSQNRAPLQDSMYQNNNNIDYSNSQAQLNSSNGANNSDALNKSSGLLQGIRDKLAMLQKSKHELENKIYNFESKLKDGTSTSGGHGGSTYKKY